MRTKRRTYHTIVIDPPWPGPGATPAFNDKPSIMLPYATMTGVQVAAMGVDRLASQTAQLFIWTTSRNVGDAYLLLQGWGFKYRGLLVWLKNGIGPGRHVRSQCEFCLWGGRRGAPMVEPSEAPHQVQTWPRGAHSEKPAAAYELFRKLSPPPRLDIFARRKHRGFEPWGNETEQRLGITSE